jgi:hypothetical protein
VVVTPPLHDGSDDEIAGESNGMLIEALDAPTIPSELPTSPETHLCERSPAPSCGVKEGYETHW